MRSQDMDDELEHGLALIGELVQYAQRFKREPVSVAKLKLGLLVKNTLSLSVYYIAVSIS